MVRAHGLTADETMDALLSLRLPRAAGVAAIAQALALRADGVRDSASNCRNMDTLDTWLVDRAGNIAATNGGMGLLERITSLGVPMFVSTEQAMEWGSRLNAAEHLTLVDIQRTASNAARESGDLQRMINLATQAQLIREAAEAFSPDSADAHAKTEQKI